MTVSFPVAIPENCPFGLYNVPFGIFSTFPGHGLGPVPRGGTAIGEYVLELHELVNHGIFDANPEAKAALKDAFLQPVLNKFASLSLGIRRWTRETIIASLSDPASPLFFKSDLHDKIFVPIGQVQMHLPMKITNYTDSFSSLIHAQNSMHPLGLELPPAFSEYPMGYNGRVSSIQVSGCDITRPKGFYPSPGNTRPTYQPTKQLDFEIELGAFISGSIEFGTSVNARIAADHVFGYVLHNDWSARDIQKYEMPPLGPMHSKGFVTTISPWVVTAEALEACRTDPPLSNSTPIHPSLVADEKNHGVHDIELSMDVARNNEKPVKIVRANYANSYWSVPQQIAYQSSSGHGISTGDLVASGTIASPPPVDKTGLGTYGCLLEAFAQKHVLPSVGGNPMSWLEDGDQVTMEGWFTTKDGKRSGFGGLTNLVRPADSSWG